MWARKQEKRMLKRLTEIMITNMQEVKNDVAQLKLQVNLAVAISEDAMKNTEDLSCKIKEIEKQYVTPEMLTANIEEAFRKVREEFANKTVFRVRLHIHPINRTKMEAKMLRS